MANLIRLVSVYDLNLKTADLLFIDSFKIKFTVLNFLGESIASIRNFHIIFSSSMNFFVQKYEN